MRVRSPRSVRRSVCVVERGARDREPACRARRTSVMMLGDLAARTAGRHVGAGANHVEPRAQLACRAVVESSVNAEARGGCIRKCEHQHVRDGGRGERAVEALAVRACEWRRRLDRAQVDCERAEPEPNRRARADREASEPVVARGIEARARRPRTRARARRPGRRGEAHSRPARRAPSRAEVLQTPTRNRARACDRAG